jgi:adenosylmethionine-8-amino-7-oxononanoate aminotransferase
MVNQYAILWIEIFKNLPVNVIKAEGHFIYLEDGTKILESTCGAAVACLGHGKVEVIKPKPSKHVNQLMSTA